MVIRRRLTTSPISIAGIHAPLLQIFSARRAGQCHCRGVFADTNLWAQAQWCPTTPRWEYDCGVAYLALVPSDRFWFDRCPFHHLAESSSSRHQTVGMGSAISPGVHSAEDSELVGGDTLEARRWRPPESGRPLWQLDAGSWARSGAHPGARKRWGGRPPTASKCQSGGV
jgi:hypothetical protein